MVLTSPQCLQSSGVCTLLVYLDPGLSLLAVIVLIVIAMPQVRFCVSRPSHHVCCWFVLSRPVLTVAGVLFNRSLSPGVQVWNAFATGHTSTHLHVWSWTEDWECPWGAGLARPPHLAVDWIIDGGLCPRALPCWLSCTRVRWKTLLFTLVVLNVYTMTIQNSQFWLAGSNSLSCLSFPDVSLSTFTQKRPFTYTHTFHFTRYTGPICCWHKANQPITRQPGQTTC